MNRTYRVRRRRTLRQRLRTSAWTTTRSPTSRPRSPTGRMGQDTPLGVQPDNWYLFCNNQMTGQQNRHRSRRWGIYSNGRLRSRHRAAFGVVFRNNHHHRPGTGEMYRRPRSPVGPAAACRSICMVFEHNTGTNLPWACDLHRPGAGQPGAPIRCSTRTASAWAPPPIAVPWGSISPPGRIQGLQAGHLDRLPDHLRRLIRRARSSNCPTAR